MVDVVLFFGLIAAACWCAWWLLVNSVVGLRRLVLELWQAFAGLCRLLGRLFCWAAGVQSGPVVVRVALPPAGDFSALEDWLDSRACLRPSGRPPQAGKPQGGGPRLFPHPPERWIADYQPWDSSTALSFPD